MSDIEIRSRLSEETPEGWQVTTTAAHHFALYHDSGRTIAMNEHRGEWTVMGLKQYGDADYPRFALEESPEEAVEAAVDAMEAANTGDPEAAEIAARASDLESPSTDGTEADIESMSSEDSDAGYADSDDETADTSEAEDDGTDAGQASLTEFSPNN